MAAVAKIYLIRHGATEWSATGRHTSRTDVPLSEDGRRQASHLQAMLQNLRFSVVLTSPLQRARQTCELAGLGARARVEPELLEWDYGAYEGQTTAQIHGTRPHWNLFNDGCPEGESSAQISARADRLLAALSQAEGLVALFSHGHFLRVVASRWIGLPAREGQHLALDPASLGVLGFEHPGGGVPTLSQWNAGPHGLFPNGA